MPALIPFQPSIANYRFSTTLDGIPFWFRVRWNDAVASLNPGNVGGWHIDILDAQESPIRHGVPVVLGLPLAYIGRDPRRPPGILIPVDTSGDDIDPGFDDLGGRVQVWFFTWAEVGQMITDLRAT